MWKPFVENAYTLLITFIIEKFAQQVIRGLIIDIYADHP